MIEAVYTTMRVGRNLLQWYLEPLDRGARLLNNKHNYPPLRLRQAVGNLNDFEGSAAEYVTYLKLLGGLKFLDDLVDIGCGCATILTEVTENKLLEYVNTYYGLDIDKKAIDWCQKRYKGTNAHFKWLNNVEEGLAYRSLPIASSSVDVVLCKSLFTHLEWYVLEDYLKEIHRVLRPKGTCLATFFVIDDRPPNGRYTFRYRGLRCWHERDTKPDLAVAYDLNVLVDLFTKVGFSYNIHYGTWRGDNKGLSFQDIVILRKEGEK